MALPGEMGRSPARMVDDTTTYPWPESFPKVLSGQDSLPSFRRLFRSGRGKPRVSGHSTSQPFVGPTYWRNAKSCDMACAVLYRRRVIEDSRRLRVV
jgi:hypothetical protein